MRILFDIGANRGLYTDAQINRYDKIILVEANSDLCFFLKEKYRENNKIKVVNKIVSKDNNSIFYKCNADTISTADIEWITQSRFSNNYQWTPVEGLETISIDKLIEEEGIPSFIKIDVEGYEYNVIQSLSFKIPLCFEWAEEKKSEIILTIEYLYSLGYEYFGLQEEDNYSYINEIWVSKDNILQYINSLIPERSLKWGMVWVK